MGTYIISLLSASFAIALITIMLPEGSIGRHFRLISALFLVCVLIVPITKFTATVKELINGNFTLTDTEGGNEADMQNALQSALDSSSKQYFLDSLAQTLTTEFAIEAGDLRCLASWKEQNGETKPNRITVLLSGSAIWKDPKKIEAYVTELLGCECVTAIE